mgnify:CR=1 FL=1
MSIAFRIVSTFAQAGVSATQGADLAPVQGAQFRQHGPQRYGSHRADAEDPAQQFLRRAPDRAGPDLALPVIVEVLESPFPPVDRGLEVGADCTSIQASVNNRIDHPLRAIRA